MEKKVILRTDESAATLMTVTGWVSRNGRFCGKDEDMARYDGATHNQCSCGAIIEKGWLICSKCREKNANEAYAKLEYKKWDGETPMSIYRDDVYFMDEDDLFLYLDEHELQLEDINLVLCQPTKLSTIPDDLWDDDLPEDVELPKEIANKVDELNALIKNLPTFSWSQSNFRTSYEKP